MTRELYVVRNADDPKKNSAILPEEWEALAERDPALSRFAPDGLTYVAVGLRADGTDAWFNWFDGMLTSPNPDRTTALKLIGFAKSLAAQVVTDEWEQVDATALDHIGLER